MSASAGLPDVKPGTTLRLAKGEWSNGLKPADTHIIFQVTKVHSDRVPELPSGFWVSGHVPECSQPTARQHQPCVMVYVYAATLARKSVPK